MATPNPTSLKVKRFWLWSAREALRIKESWELAPVPFFLLFAMTFGFLAGIGSFILTHELTSAIIAGCLAFFLNGFVLGKACFSAKDPWEIQDKIFLLDQEITKTLEILQTIKEEELLRQGILQREKEEQRLEAERQEKALKRQQKIQEEEQKQQALEEAHQLAVHRENQSRQWRRNHGNTCWYCRQPLLPGWIQCVICRMLS